jgi:hypothetical protein
MKKSINNYLSLPNGTIAVALTQGQVAIIDACDFDLVKDYKWYRDYHADGDYYYAMTTKIINKKKIGIRMHRFILGITDRKLHRDHINHDTLNNTRANLREATISQSQTNRRFGNNSTGTFINESTDGKLRSLRMLNTSRSILKHLRPH